jgi:hypothetical protein
VWVRIPPWSRIKTNAIKIISSKLDYFNSICFFKAQLYWGKAK